MRFAPVFLTALLAYSPLAFAKMDAETLKQHQAALAEHDKQVQAVDLNALMADYDKSLREQDSNGDGQFSDEELVKSGINPSQAIAKSVQNISDAAKGQEDNSVNQTEKPLEAIPALGR